jgi:uncharacterized protein (DUF924 family)
MNVSAATDVSEPLAMPREIIDFWFSPETRPHWFTASEAFDKAVRAHFGALYERAYAGQVDDWASTPHSALALILLLDQVPRNIFRGTARAFASDREALAFAQKAVSAGFDSEVAKDQRLFFYLPFQHAEDRAIQDEAVRLVAALGDEENTDYFSLLQPIDQSDRMGRKWIWHLESRAFCRLSQPHTSAYSVLV